jgi:nitroimidazol reductase NimA-like FMN-containing flavoprotein (pyridoxamine 5'-phosphate oxidase superfamily)
VTGVADPAALAREVVDANQYMVLGTADAEGNPWVSPVYFAHAAYREFYWVSRPSRRHSQNLAAHPQLSIVIFDSSVPIGTGRGVYLSATAGQVTDAEQARIGLEVFSERSIAHGGRAFTAADVEEPAALRLYRATTETVEVVYQDDNRVRVTL